VGQIDHCLCAPLEELADDHALQEPGEVVFADDADRAR
jgi:hypothetical protein